MELSRTFVTKTKYIQPPIPGGKPTGVRHELVYIGQWMEKDGTFTDLTPIRINGVTQKKEGIIWKLGGKLT